MSAERSVVVTGVGVLSAFGRGMAELATGLREGRSALAAPRAFDPGGLEFTVAAEVRTPLSVPPGFEDDRKAAMALLAARDAVGTVDMSGAGVYLGTGLSSVTPRELEQDAAPYRRDGGFDRAALHRDLASDRVAPNRHLPERTTALLADSLGARGPQLTSFSACAAGALGIAHAFRAIRRGELDRALAGGMDAMIHPLGVLSFLVLGALSPGTCRPFDRNRSGFVIGEGAAMLLLEEESVARARGAHILARVLGAGSSVDAYNVTAPHPEGKGAELSMRRALKDAGLDRVDHVNAHGTGTPLGDKAEAAAISRLLGSEVNVSSIKGAVGHCIAAAGAVEAAACIAGLAEGWSPGTALCESVDDLGVRVQQEPAFDAPQTMLSNSFGFGGQNTTLIFGRA
ncbi:MAG: beta-ketoacyl-[acyl-carrier-protein] synthase family protein [Myxococcota bacterium]|nr:beta-ketoacyl-[acyl-carrier-protein] synthase family protein [Myxococcota bacterium]